jgi:predicted nuclease of restriction endonuclease-like (RecB) superfamily
MRNKKSVMTPTGFQEAPRLSRGRTRLNATFPAPGPISEMPEDYAGTLSEIKERIKGVRLRAVLSANAAMVLLYWDIGRIILNRQEKEGWGARVIDRLSADLRTAFPEIKGFSPRNLKYMRSFADAWPDHEIVQEVLAQIPWYHNIDVLVKSKIGINS